MRRYHSLSNEEENIIDRKGTEKPWSGNFCAFAKPGVYLCRRCDAPLFLSSEKFDSPCGWPSFEHALKEAVLCRPDGDRTEIMCARCLAHLGHVFAETRTRHCVNSLSLAFAPLYTEDGYERAIVGAGCFWGVQKAYDGLSVVLRTCTGYIGGHVVEPSYKEVCTGETGHTECVEVVFERGLYPNILDHFFEIHDSSHIYPTQYKSVLFYLSSQQKETIFEKIAYKLAEGYKVVTEVLPSSHFYLAEPEHQHR